MSGFRTFVAVWATQSLSLLGTTITYFAVSIWLAQVLYPAPAQKPALALALSAVTVAYMLPLLLAPLAGAWADRHDRRATMAAMDLASAGVDAVLAALLLTGRLELGALVVLAALYAVCSTFHIQSFNACYVMLVPEAQLPRANGMMQSMQGISGIVAPAAATFLIAVPALAGHAGSAGVGLAVAADGLTFVVAGVTLLFLHIPTPARDAGDRGGFWQDAGFGATYIWRRRPLLWLLGTFTVVNFVMGFQQVLLPLVVKFDLSAYPFRTGYALLATVGSIGGVVGGFAISAWGGLRRRRVLGVLVPMIAEAAGQVAFGASHLLYLSAGMLAVMFSASPLANAHSQAIWQSQVPPAMQGRVFAMRRLIAQCTSPVSAALAGWAGATFDPGLVLAVLGVVSAAFCAAQLFNRALMRVEDRDWLEGLAAAATRPGSSPPAPTSGPS